jgi:SAM-dependent methyltransferase
LSARIGALAARPAFERILGCMGRMPQSSLVAVWEEWLSAYGDSTHGVGWPRGDAELRYQVMLDLIRPSSDRVSLLDFGCGASHLLETIRRRGLDRIDYSGLDLSDRFLALSRSKFPGVTYYQTDVLDVEPIPLPIFDYVVMNGLFTYQGAFSYETMFDYLCEMLRRISTHMRVGLAFNVMSTHVDRERRDLFHVSMDPLLAFLATEVSRHVVVRHDYSLYEYTVYVYATPTLGDPAAKRLVERVNF